MTVLLREPTQPGTMALFWIASLWILPYKPVKVDPTHTIFFKAMFL